MSCTPISLVGIGLDCGSVGGLSVVYIVDREDVASVSIVNGEVSGITMESGKTFKTFNFRKSNASLTSTGTRNDPNGTLFYNTVVELKFNKMETVKRTDVSAISSGNCYLIAKDNNGLYWLVGYSTLDTYLFGSTVGSTGAAMADANQYVVTISGETPELPYQIASGFSVAAIVS